MARRIDFSWGKSLRLLLALGFLTFALRPAHAQRQMEPLGRGLIVLHATTSQAYLSWRLLATDPDNIGFNIYRAANGGAGVKLNSSVLTTTTDYLDPTADFALSNAWYVVPVVNGVEQSPSAPYGLAANSPVRQYLSIPLVNPGPYSPYDVKFSWFGDFDGDGEYEYLVDRHSTTGGANQFLQAYKLDGTFLWQMDMGFNSTNTANAYEPDAAAISIGDKDNVTVYDLDGDGKAEVIVRTANGTIFADYSQVATNNNTVQFLSILDGMTGVEKARAIIPNPYFADGPLNMHAGIAYLDGIHPSVIFSGENRVGSGAFQRLTVAWDYRNGQLTQRWIYQTPVGQNDSEGHQLRVADVNHDGKDDIVRIGSIITELTNGIPTTLYSTELQHGDRYHVTDIDPERPGLEMFAIQQNNATLLATTLQDLGSGVLFKKWYSSGIVDVGRGITLDMTPSYRGCEMYSTQPGIFDRKGTQIYANNLWAPEGIWWDGDLLREFEDGAGSGALSPVVNKFNPATGAADRIYTLYSEDGGCHQAYGGRAAVWGDLFGDWREEFMVVANDYNSVRIYTTKIPATNRIYCLMQNPMYRVQCTYKGYYQASYVDYYLGNDMPAIPIPPLSDAQLVWRGNDGSVWDANTTFSWFTNNLWVSNNISTTFSSGKTVLFDTSGSNAMAIAITGTLAPGDVRVHSPKSYVFDSASGDLSGVMKLTKAGAGGLTLLGTNTYSGATLVGEGQLIVNGALPNSPVTVRGGVWLDGRLGGTGVIGGSVRFEEGAGFSPANGTNAPGTLTIANNVTLANRTLHDFDLSDDPTGMAKTNDLVVIAGSLTLQGTNTINIRKLNSNLPAGVYPLINYSGALSGSLANLTVSGLPGIPVALTNPPGQIALVVKSYRAPATITWTGGSSGNVWNLLSASNFLNGAAKDQFAPGDSVRFDNLGTSNLTVNLSGDLNTTAVLVDSTANYTLAGSGGIIGSASLTKSNTGTLTISALNNSFTGKTTIAGGTVIVNELDAVGYPSPLGNPPGGATNLVLHGGSTLRVTGESYTDRGMTLNTGQNTLDVFNAADQVTVAGQITGSGTLVKAGAGTLALNVSNTFSGGVIISNGVISLGSTAGNQTGVGAGSVTFYNGTLSMINIQASETATWPMVVPAGATGRLDCDGRCTLSGALTGGGTFTVMTPYVRTDFSGNWSAFTGQLNIVTDSDGGDFRCNNSAGYPNARINLASLVSLQCRLANTPTISIGELSGSPGCSASAGGGNGGLGVTWSVGGLNTSTTFAGNTYNGINFIKVGTGTWIWSGTNLAHTGTTTVTGGTLLLNGNAASASGNVTVGSSGTLGGSGAVGGAVTVNGKLAPGNNAIGTLVCNGNVTLNAGSTTTIEINKGSGTRDLLDSNATVTYGGTLVVTNLSGTLALNDSFKIFDAAAYAGSFNNFVLPPLGGSLAWNTASLVTNGTISIISSGALPTVPDAPTNLVATAASYSQINLTWADASTNEANFLIERSTNAVNFSQIASVGAGVTGYSDLGLTGSTTYYYRVRASNAGGNSAYSNIASTTTPAAPASLVWRGDGAANQWDVNASANWNNSGSLTAFSDGLGAIFDDSGSNNVLVSIIGAPAPNSVIFSAAKNYTFGGTGGISGPGMLIKNGSGTLTITNGQTFSGGVQANFGTIALTHFAAGGTGTLNFNGGNVLLNGAGGPATYSNPLSFNSNSAITTSGSSGANNVAVSGAWTGSADLNLTNVSGSTFSINGNMSAYAGRIALWSSGSFRLMAGTTGSSNAAFILGISTAQLSSRDGNATFHLGSLEGGPNSVLRGAGSVNAPSTYSIGGNNASTTFFGTISNGLQAANSTTVNIIKVGAGTLTLAGASTYSGTTTISGGVLQIGDGGTTGMLATNSVINNATLSYTRADNLTDTGLISGTGMVIQDGDGVLTFTKSHSYSGPTLINSGTLALSGSGSISNSSGINIASGATLDVSGRTGGTWVMTSGKTLSGSGSVNGSFILGSGAKLTPGNSVGTLTFSNNLTLNTGSTITMELTRPPATSDRLKVMSSLACGGALVVTNISGSTLQGGDSFQLFDAGVISGNFSSVALPALAAGLLWNTNSLLIDGTLKVFSTAPAKFETVQSLPDRTIRLTFSGPAGNSFEVRASTDVGLKPLTAWPLIGSGAFAGSVVTLDDPAATNYLQRYYLLRLP